MGFCCWFVCGPDSASSNMIRQLEHSKAAACCSGEGGRQGVGGGGGGEVGGWGVRKPVIRCYMLCAHHL